VRVLASGAPTTAATRSAASRSAFCGPRRRGGRRRRRHARPLRSLHPCLAIGSNDNASDSDGDHFGAGGEYQVGTDPCRSDSDRGGENDAEIARGGNPFDPRDDLLPAPGYFALVTRVSEHVDDDPRFVPRPLANLLRIPSAPEYATVEIERRASPTAPWLPLVQVDPRTLGGVFADEGLPKASRSSTACTASTRRARAR
jgi:hypothetical protein